MKKIRIAYIMDGPVGSTYSGNANYIFQNLLLQGFDVIPIEVDLPVLKSVLIKKYLYARIFKRVLIYKRDNKVLNAFARIVERKIKEAQPDLLFSHFEWILSNVKSSLPIIAWPDNCFYDFVNFYSVLPWSHESVRNGIKQTQQYYSKANYTVYSSEWALRSSLDRRLCSSDKCCYIPYGVNMSPRPDDERIRKSIEAKDFEMLEFVWMGYDAKRKGLIKAIAIVNRLNERGYNCRLHIVGIADGESLSKDLIELDHCVFYGKLNKHDAEQSAVFYNLFYNSHFMLFPTLADCSPMVVGDSNSFGVPVLAHEVGGIGSLVIHGKTGGLFARDSSVDVFVDFIIENIRTPLVYKNLTIGALDQVKEHLDWTKSVGKLSKIIMHVLETRPTSNDQAE